MKASHSFAFATIVIAMAASHAPRASAQLSAQTTPTSELVSVLARYAADRAALLRRYDAAYSPVRRHRLHDFETGWRERLATMDFDALGVEGRIDYVLLNNRITYELETLAREEALFAQTQPILPFATTIFDLHESRRRLESINPAAAAATLEALGKHIEQARQALYQDAASPSAVTRIVAYRAAGVISGMRRTMQRWFDFYAGYDPLFTWWAAAPHEQADAALATYASALRERIVGIREGEDEPIVGSPIGASGLRSDLAHEMIVYTPEELIAIAEEEFAWNEAEMLRASREMGFGDDWRAALEKVKTMHVEPGRQTDVVRDLAYEAIDFLEERDLLTIPPLAKEIWRMEMMSPARQRVNPFFTGGETIRVSFPTDEMSHDGKMMSMRGNNVPFSRATVHHELIPGHHLQGFMTERYNAHRNLFRTPFWGEGWALYWEMLLWDLEFPPTPEDRIGMLFWRSHRAARIIFSLSFHLGRWTPQQAIDFLVERVGHERANAEAEVRRSFNGSYSPLYQAAYLLGGMQIRALHRELVESGQMTNKEFHDTILQGGRMPIEMVRVRLLGELIPKDYAARWRFGG